NGNIIGVDPLFFSNPDAGFDLTWGTADDITGDYHLTNGSGAIDSGDNTALPADAYDLDQNSDTAETLPVDLDGNIRVNNTTVDMGAYEITPADTTPPTDPANLTQTVTGADVAFDWDDSADDDGVMQYEIQVADNAGFSSPQSLNPTSSDASITSMADGNYFWRVRAQDNFGNWSAWSASASFAVDTTAPSIPAGLTPAVTGSVVTFDWSDSSDSISGVKQYEMQVASDSGFSSIVNTLTDLPTSQSDLSGMANGSYYWRVRTQDNSGNWSAWSDSGNFAINVTSDLPTTPDTLTETVTNSDVAFDWSDSTDDDGIKQYEIQVADNAGFNNSQILNPTSSDTNITSMADGSYFWRVRGQDNNDNWGAWSTARSFDVDVTAPDIPTGLTQTVTSSDAALDWSDSADNVTGVKQYEVELATDSGFSNIVDTQSSAASNADLSGLSNGSYYWRVRTQDNAGNWSTWSTSSSFDVTVIGDVPTTPDGLTQTVTGSDVALDWSDSTDDDGVKQYEIQVADNAGFSSPQILNSTDSSKIINSLADGSYFWRVRGQDNNNNWGTWSTSGSFDVDITAPDIPTGLTQTITGSDAALDWSDATDNVTGVKQYQVELASDSGFSNIVDTQSLTASNADLSGLTDGSYYWRVRTQDNAGNWSNWSTSSSFNLDTTAPSIPDGLTQTDNGGGSVSFDWNDSADTNGVAQYELRVDNNNDFSSPENTTTATVSSATITGIADGAYFWQVRSQDNSGNWSAWSTSGNVTIDTTAPSVPDGMTQTVTGSNVAFEWNDASDANGVAQYEMQVDNNNDFSSPENTLTPAVSSANLNGMTDGSYFWRVRTQDNFGNWSSWSTSGNFVIDITLPTTPDGLTQTSNGGGSVSFDWNDASDSSGIAQYQLQADNNNNFSSPEKNVTSATSDVTVTGILEGSYFWRVRAQDNAGNWSAWSTVSNLDVDTTAPAVPKSLIQVVSGNNVTFDWSDSTDARAGLKQYEMQVDNNNDFSSPENTLTPAVSSADLSGMADGSYFWRVRALDNAGNWSNWSSSSSFS
ncbi:MAG: choice-of-anchor Q domain-containing protein, partial [Victivallaceae bacterium]